VDIINNRMNMPIKVLLIEDDEDDYILTQDIISEIPGKEYELDWASSFEEGVKAIISNAYDVYLLDYRLGKDSGLELLKKVMQYDLNAPLILLTGQGDREIDLEAMEAGASDFIVKGELRPDLLDRSIRYSMQQFKHIHELKIKEEELQQLNVQLEQKVEERTAELEKTHEELKKALEAEKLLSKLKSRFVSMASHEFKTPLTSILSSASLIARYDKTEQHDKRLRHLDRIKSSVANLTNILSDFLSVEKIESGGVNCNPQVIDVQDFMEEVLDNMTPLLKPGQHINFEHHGANQIFIDKHLLKNILINLLSNAIKYSPKDKNIDLSLTTNNHIDIKVVDYGIGIPEEDKGHMFSRFFRAGNATNIQGTGLGLNIVKRYLDLMGGNIDFESKLGEGTTFIVFIPNTAVE